MDQLISKAGSTLVTFAVRSGIQVASTYVIKSVSNLIDHVPHQEKSRLERKRNELQNKIETLTFSIDVIQILAARGNSNLDSVLRLTDYLKQDIEDFNSDISTTLSDNDNKKLNVDSVKLIEKSIDELVSKIDNIVPLLSLVLTTYGTSSINNFHDYVSPGRLLNAVVLVDKSNQKFKSKNVEVVVGPKFSTTFYNIFYNPQPSGESKIIWREKFAKSAFKVVRIPDETSEFAYDIRISEDFDDGRYHDESAETPDTKVFDIRQITKVFFSASGRLLKLSDNPAPVLVLKLRKTTRTGIDKKLEEEFEPIEELDNNFEWIAIGDYPGNNNQSDQSSEELDLLEDELGDSDIKKDESNDDDDDNNGSLFEDAVEFDEDALDRTVGQFGLNNGSRISLLEYLIRLCTLQANDQTDILNVKDERLRLYLSDENYAANKATKIPALSKKMESLKI